MFDDALELAENKLLILYIFNKLDISISNNKITEIILENNLINYFTLQQYLAELKNSKFLIKNDSNKSLFEISEKGKKVLSMFIDRVAPNKLDFIDDYLDKKLTTQKKEISISADYTLENEDEFIVHLKSFKNDSLIMDLNFCINSKELSDTICENWNKNSSLLQSKILEILTTQKK